MIRFGLLGCVVAFAAGLATAGSPSRPPEAKEASASDRSVPSVLRVVLFQSSNCLECKEAVEAVEASAKRWGDRIRLEKRDTAETQTFLELWPYEKHYGSNENVPSKVFVGSQYLAGAKVIVRRLDEVIAQELEKGSVTFVPAEKEAEPADGQAQPAGKDAGAPSGLVERFEGFSVVAVAAAGLLDGINPCAFTTIVFLLSMLALLGKTRRQLAVVGVGFTSAVFVTYFLLGLGLLGAVKAFSASYGISVGLAYAVAILAFALAAWSLVDFIRYVRSGDVTKITLALPKSVKASIHKLIRVGLNTRNLVIGSFAVGCLIALLESLCTGQVYLPTIMYVARSPGLRAHAIGFLLLYNVMFIAPLVGILVVAYYGVSSERLGEFLRRHLAALKLAMAVLFAGLGMLILATL